MRKSRFRQIIEKIPLETRTYVRKQGEIAVQINELRKNKEMTQKELAEKLGVKESFISRILAGHENLTLKTITKLESALESDIIQVPMFIKTEDLDKSIGFVTVVRNVSTVDRFNPVFRSSARSQKSHLTYLPQ